MYTLHACKSQCLLTENTNGTPGICILSHNSTQVMHYALCYNVLWYMCTCEEKLRYQYTPKLSSFPKRCFSVFQIYLIMIFNFKKLDEKRFILCKIRDEKHFLHNYPN